MQNNSHFMSFNLLMNIHHVLVHAQFSLCVISWTILVGVWALVGMVLLWSILFVKDNCSIIELYERIQSGSVDISGSNSHAFVFPTHKTVEFLVWLERNKRDLFRHARLHEWNTGLKWLLLKAFHELLEDSDYDSLSNDADLDYLRENRWRKEPAVPRP